jgi:hypothetical protein
MLSVRILPFGTILTYRKILVSLEDLYRSCLIWIKDIPVVNCGICHQTNGRHAEPLPEDNILIHCRGLQLCLLTKVEYLQGPRLCLQCYDLLRPVHDGTIRLDRAPDGGRSNILKVDDDDFGGAGLVLLLADTDEGVGFKCLSVD